MKKLLLLVSIVFLLGCTSVDENIQTSGDTPFNMVSFESDKFSYKSKEIIEMELVVESVVDTNATLFVYGVYSGRNRVYREEPVEIIAGMNYFTVEERLPSCTGCAGIRPGNYTVAAKIVDNQNHSLENIILIGVG